MSDMTVAAMDIQRGLLEVAKALNRIAAVQEERLSIKKAVEAEHKAAYERWQKENPGMGPLHDPAEAALTSSQCRMDYCTAFRGFGSDHCAEHSTRRQRPRCEVVACELERETGSTRCKEHENPS